MPSGSDSARSGRRLAASDLADDVAVVLASGLPGRSSAPRSAIDRVIGARIRPASRRAPSGSAAYDAALVWSLLHSGYPTEAVELADRVVTALRRAAGLASPATQSACYSVVAEAYLLNGRLRESAQCCQFAEDYATEADDDGCRYRALGLRAATLVSSGEVSAAAEAAAQAEELARASDWPQAQSSWPLVLGQVMIRARRADAAGIERALTTFRRARGDDVIATAVARFSRVVLQAVRQDNAGIVANARVIAQGSDTRLSAPFIIDMAIEMESVAHVHLGDPGAALAVLEGRRSPQDHSVCFELLRATAYLQLGDFRGVLRETEECVRNQPEHNLGMLASVQLRRALAYEALGQRHRADAEYSKANHLALEIGAVSATLGLPMEALLVLFARLAVHEPDVARQITQLLPEDYSFPDPEPLSFAPPRLTDREGVLAGWLATELSLSAIAAQLHVSINTVKSQLQTLYRKLDVRSRSEAVARLERIGAIDRPDTRAPGDHDS